MNKIYLAGPMTGLPRYNEAAFNEWADRLRAEGNVVFNPAETEISLMIANGNRNQPQDHREAMRVDLEWICAEADEIALLPGWENSPGAMAEFFTAKACKLKFRYL